MSLIVEVSAEEPKGTFINLRAILAGPTASRRGRVGEHAASAVARPVRTDAVSVEVAWRLEVVPFGPPIAGFRLYLSNWERDLGSADGGPLPLHRPRRRQCTQNGICPRGEALRGN
jgi:hypothetical protein